MYNNDGLNVNSALDNRAKVVSPRDKVNKSRQLPDQVSKSRYLPDRNILSTATAYKSDIYSRGFNRKLDRATIGNSLSPNVFTHRNCTGKEAWLRGHVILSGELSLSFPTVSAVQPTDRTDTTHKQPSSTQPDSWHRPSEFQIEALKSIYLPVNKNSFRTLKFSKLNLAASKPPKKDAFNCVIPEATMRSCKNERRACKRDEMCWGRYGPETERSREASKRLGGGKSSKREQCLETQSYQNDVMFLKLSREGPTNYVIDKCSTVKQGLSQQGSQTFRLNQANRPLQLNLKQTMSHSQNSPTSTKLYWRSNMPTNVLNQGGRCDKLITVNTKPSLFKKEDSFKERPHEKLQISSEESKHDRPNPLRGHQHLNQPGHRQVFVIGVESARDNIQISDVSGVSPHDVRQAPHLDVRKSLFLSVPTTDVSGVSPYDVKQAPHLDVRKSLFLCVPTTDVSEQRPPLTPEKSKSH